MAWSVSGEHEVCLSLLTDLLSDPYKIICLARQQVNVANVGETLRIAMMRLLKGAQLSESQPAGDGYPVLVIGYWSTCEHITIIQKGSHCPPNIRLYLDTPCFIKACEENKMRLSLLYKLGVLNLLDELKRECYLTDSLKSRGCTAHAHLRKGIYLTSAVLIKYCVSTRDNWLEEGEFNKVAFQWSR